MFCLQRHSLLFERMLKDLPYDKNYTTLSTMTCTEQLLSSKIISVCVVSPPQPMPIVACGPIPPIMSERGPNLPACQ